MTSLMKNVVHWTSSSQRAKAAAAPVVAPVDLCEICGKKPKFVENGHKHPYCSRSCARNGAGPSLAACLLRGCRATGKPAFGNFCSEAHARDGVRSGQVEGCEYCLAMPRNVGTMCIACDRLIRTEPRLRELGSDTKMFKNLRAQFLSEWDSPKKAPTVEKVYEVVLPREARSRHERFKAANPRFEEVRSFHSSQCICDLGTKQPELCSFKSCGICYIVRSCFKSFAFGESYNRGRFGDGIYSYRNPGLADNFSTSCTTSPYRVMIACDVLVEPGQTAGDEAADEESLFVQSADAILPVYVVMYCQV